MTSPNSSGPNQSRILVAVAPYRQNLTVLQTAVSLAQRKHAELVALFVEDENLLHMAELPFVREIHRASAIDRVLDPKQVMRTLQRQADNLRQTLLQAAQAYHVQTTLKVVRGQFLAEALAAAVETDITFLSIAEHTIALPGRRRPVAAVHTKPIWTLFDSTETAIRALQLAAELAFYSAAELILLLPTTQLEQMRQLQIEAAKHLKNHAPARYVAIPNSEPQAVITALRQRGLSLLVLYHSATLPMDSYKELLNSIECPVLLVR